MWSDTVVTWNVLRVFHRRWTDQERLSSITRGLRSCRLRRRSKLCCRWGKWPRARFSPVSSVCPCLIFLHLRMLSWFVLFLFAGDYDGALSVFTEMQLMCQERGLQLAGTSTPVGERGQKSLETRVLSSAFCSLRWQAERKHRQNRPL